MHSVAAEQFETGLHHGLDPPNAEMSEGEAMTTLYSPWVGAKCVTCLHTFRPDDTVLIELGEREGLVVRHSSAALPCADPSQPPAGIGAATATAFFAGVDCENASPGGAPVRHLLAGDALLVRRPDRHHCRVCAHTFRPLEAVVVCPCSPDDPICALAIHRDPGRGLTCLDDWKPTGVFTRCPMNYREL